MATKKRTGTRTNVHSQLGENIAQSIIVLRRQRVLLDADLAGLYGVDTKRLNEQVRRNKARFPADFIFQLQQDEFANLKSQSATSSWGGTRKLPMAFTEHGAIMAATVLNSARAVEMTIHVVLHSCSFGTCWLQTRNCRNNFACWSARLLRMTRRYRHHQNYPTDDESGRA